MPVTDRLPQTDAKHSVVARRSGSLAPRQRWNVYGAFAAGSLALAFSFAAGGVWPVLPFSVLGASAVLVWMVTGAIDPAVTQAQVVGTALVATMLGLAIVEHLLLVLPFPSTALWRWALRGGTAVATRRPAVAAHVNLEPHEDLFRTR